MPYWQAGSTACRGHGQYTAVSPSPWLLHVGLYAYRQEFLVRLTSLPPSRLEQLEKLEQLRALQIGESIAVGIVQDAAVGIDTPEDYDAFVSRMRNAS